ncbi:MAG: RNA-directed DNA polymerase, partial [Aeromonas sp.]
DDWKMAEVVAIYKSGSKTKVENYRPVSLTSIFSKVLEKIVRKQLCHHLLTNDLINKSQHGFLRGKSCLTNLLSFMNEVTCRLDEGQEVEVCYIDFSKAFDSVSHDLLLLKLGYFGLGTKVIDWVADFLRGRTFNVRVGTSLSKTVTATSGVPQGSVLGPILFLLFINDLTFKLENPSFIFADDVKIVGQNLVKDIREVRKWSQTWDLPLNENKCCILTSKKESETVTSTGFMAVTEVRDLGVRITSDFKPSKHCIVAAQKARNELFRICGTVSSRNPEVMVPLYKAIVRPHLEYCVQAWAPYSRKDTECVEKVQKQATRLIRHQKLISYKDRLKKLDLFSLTKRRLRGDLIETFKIVKGISGSKLEEFFRFIPVDKTRGHSLRLARTHSRLDIRKSFFSNRVIKWWNKLPGKVVQCTSIITFKKELDDCWEAVFPEVG